VLAAAPSAVAAGSRAPDQQRVGHEQPGQQPEREPRRAEQPAVQRVAADLGEAAEAEADPAGEQGAGQRGGGAQLQHAARQPAAHLGCGQHQRAADGELHHHQKDHVGQRIEAHAAQAKRAGVCAAAQIMLPSPARAGKLTPQPGMAQGCG